MNYVKHIRRGTRHLLQMPGLTLCGVYVSTRNYTSPGPVREDTEISCAVCLKKYDRKVVNELLSESLK